MKEYEKLQSFGILPNDYLKPEVKCNFFVSAERKKTWAVLLDMLYQFDLICKKYQLTYYLFYGTLLGAIRHKGFIPWDDDIDIAMPRKDYEIFIKLKDEFQSPLFLQTPYTDPNYFYTFAKIRNSNTTQIIDLFKYAGFNQGIWLSVFPLDYWNDSWGEERYERLKQLATNNSTYMRMNNPDLSPRDMKRVKEYNSNPLRDYETIQSLASEYTNPDCKHVMTAVITQGTFKQKLLDAADFSRSIPVLFEGLTVSAPCGYDHLLTVWYDDYMQFPPIEQRGEWHSGTTIDPDTPYKEYLNNMGIL